MRAGKKCRGGVLKLDPFSLGEAKCKVLHWKNNGSEMQDEVRQKVPRGGFEVRSTTSRRGRMSGFASEKPWF